MMRLCNTWEHLFAEVEKEIEYGIIGTAERVKNILRKLLLK